MLVGEIKIEPMRGDWLMSRISKGYRAAAMYAAVEVVTKDCAKRHVSSVLTIEEVISRVGITRDDLYDVLSLSLHRNQTNNSWIGCIGGDNV